MNTKTDLAGRLRTHALTRETISHDAEGAQKALRALHAYSELMLEAAEALSSSDDRVGVKADFQGGAAEWVNAALSPEVLHDKPERLFRFFEEATELVQALGMSRDEMNAVLNQVWGQPVGEPHQEVGGVMMTLAALCAAFGFSMADEGRRELDRVWKNINKIREKQKLKVRRLAPASSGEMEEPDEQFQYNPHSAGARAGAKAAEQAARVFRETLRAPASPEKDDEREAMEAVMQNVDPALWPGLTMEQRCALGRFAKPQSPEKDEPVAPFKWWAVREGMDPILCHNQEDAKWFAEIGREIIPLYRAPPSLADAVAALKEAREIFTEVRAFLQDVEARGERLKAIIVLIAKIDAALAKIEGGRS